jgi:hypothetical protein
LKLFRIYEVWASVYEQPTPPTGPSMSLQARIISEQELAGNLIFVEIYCNDVTALAGWQYELHYDPLILTYAADYVYYPWTDTVPDFGADYVGNAGTIPVTDPLYLTGMTGDFAVSRIYFVINDDGSGFPVEPNFSWLRLAISFMGDPEAGKLAHSVYNGYYGTLTPANYDEVPSPGLVGSPAIPTAESFPYGAPVSTNWFVQFPHQLDDNAWHITGWTDNGVEGLDAGDALEMERTTSPGSPPKSFIVTEIWECNADPNKYVFMILYGDFPEFPLGIGILLGLAPAIPVIYLWRRRPRKQV